MIFLARLTKIPQRVTLYLIECKANHVECNHTLHSSDPALIRPVSGLRCIIDHHQADVLRGLSGSTDSNCRFESLSISVLEKGY